MQVQKDVRSGKLTKAQAATLRTQILAVRKQELGFMKTNRANQPAGTRFVPLSADQTSQLEQSLSQVETSL